MAATKKKINFKNVKDQGQFNPRHVEPGDYVMKVVKVDDHKTNEGKEMWLFTCTRKGDARATYPYYVNNTEEKQAWKIRKLFIACGIPVPKKLVMVDPNKVVGKEFGAALEDDEYEGRMKSVIQDTFPKEDVLEADDEAPSKKKKGKPAPVEEDDDDDEDEVDLDEDDDEDTEEADDDADEDDSDDEDDDDEDDEEPEPVVVKKKAKKAAAPAPAAKKAATKKKKAKVVEDDDDEDLDLEEI